MADNKNAMLANGMQAGESQAAMSEAEKIAKATAARKLAALNNAENYRQKMKEDKEKAMSASRRREKQAKLEAAARAEEERKAALAEMLRKEREALAERNAHSDALLRAAEEDAEAQKALTEAQNNENADEGNTTAVAPAPVSAPMPAEENAPAQAFDKEDGNENIVTDTDDAENAVADTLAMPEDTEEESASAGADPFTFDFSDIDIDGAELEDEGALENGYDDDLLFEEDTDTLYTDEDGEIDGVAEDESTLVLDEDGNELEDEFDPFALEDELDDLAYEDELFDEEDIAAAAAEEVADPGVFAFDGADVALVDENGEVIGTLADEIDEYEDEELTDELAEDEESEENTEDEELYDEFEIDEELYGEELDEEEIPDDIYGMGYAYSQIIAQLQSEKQACEEKLQKLAEDTHELSRAAIDALKAHSEREALETEKITNAIKAALAELGLTAPVTEEPVAEEIPSTPEALDALETELVLDAEDVPPVDSEVEEAPEVAQEAIEEIAAEAQTIEEAIEEQITEEETIAEETPEEVTTRREARRLAVIEIKALLTENKRLDEEERILKDKEEAAADSAKIPLLVDRLYARREILQNYVTILKLAVQHRIAKYKRLGRDELTVRIKVYNKLLARCEELTGIELTLVDPKLATAILRGQPYDEIPVIVIDKNAFATVEAAKPVETVETVETVAEKVETPIAVKERPAYPVQYVDDEVFDFLAQKQSEISRLAIKRNRLTDDDTYAKTRGEHLAILVERLEAQRLIVAKLSSALDAANQVDSDYLGEYKARLECEIDRYNRYARDLMAYADVTVPLADTDTAERILAKRPYKMLPIVDERIFHRAAEEAPVAAAPAMAPTAPEAPIVAEEAPIEEAVVAPTVSEDAPIVAQTLAYEEPAQEEEKFVPYSELQPTEKYANPRAMYVDTPEELAPAAPAVNEEPREELPAHRRADLEAAGNDYIGYEAPPAHRVTYDFDDSEPTFDPREPAYRGFEDETKPETLGVTSPVAKPAEDETEKITRKDYPAFIKKTKREIKALEKTRDEAAKKQKKSKGAERVKALLEKRNAEGEIIRDYCAILTVANALDKSGDVKKYSKILRNEITYFNKTSKEYKKLTGKELSVTSNTIPEDIVNGRPYTPPMRAEYDGDGRDAGRTPAPVIADTSDELLTPTENIVSQPTMAAPAEEAKNETLTVTKEEYPRFVKEKKKEIALLQKKRDEAAKKQKKTKGAESARALLEKRNAEGDIVRAESALLTAAVALDVKKDEGKYKSHLKKSINRFNKTSDEYKKLTDTELSTVSKKIPTDIIKGRPYTLPMRAEFDEAQTLVQAPIQAPVLEQSELHVEDKVADRRFERESDDRRIDAERTHAKRIGAISAARAAREEKLIREYEKYGEWERARALANVPKEADEDDFLAYKTAVAERAVQPTVTEREDAPEQAEESVLTYAPVRLYEAPTVESVTKAADENQDGVVSKAEYKKFVKETEAEIDTLDKEVKASKKAQKKARRDEKTVALLEKRNAEAELVRDYCALLTLANASGKKSDVKKYKKALENEIAEYNKTSKEYKKLEKNELPTVSTTIPEDILTGLTYELPAETRVAPKAATETEVKASPVAAAIPVTEKAVWNKRDARALSDYELYNGYKEANTLARTARGMAAPEVEAPVIVAQPTPAEPTYEAPAKRESEEALTYSPVNRYEAPTVESVTKAADENQDGVVSKAEYKKFVKETEAEIDTLDKEVKASKKAQKKARRDEKTVALLEKRNAEAELVRDYCALLTLANASGKKSDVKKYKKALENEIAEYNKTSKEYKKLEKNELPTVSTTIPEDILTGLTYELPVEATVAPAALDYVGAPEAVVAPLTEAAAWNKRDSRALSDYELYNEYRGGERFGKPAKAKAEPAPKKAEAPLPAKKDESPLSYEAQRKYAVSRESYEEREIESIVAKADENQDSVISKKEYKKAVKEREAEIKRFEQEYQRYEAEQKSAQGEKKAEALLNKRNAEGEIVRDYCALLTLASAVGKKNDAKKYKKALGREIATYNKTGKEYKKLTKTEISTLSTTIPEDILAGRPYVAPKSAKLSRPVDDTNVYAENLPSYYNYEQREAETLPRENVTSRRDARDARLMEEYDRHNAYYDGEKYGKAAKATAEITDRNEQELLREYRDNHQRGIEELIIGADKDNDGIISNREYKRFVKQKALENRDLASQYKAAVKEQKKQKGDDKAYAILKKRSAVGDILCNEASLLYLADTQKKTSDAKRFKKQLEKSISSYNKAGKEYKKLTGKEILTVSDTLADDILENKGSYVLPSITKIQREHVKPMQKELPKALPMDRHEEPLTVPYTLPSDSDEKKLTAGAVTTTAPTKDDKILAIYNTRDYKRHRKATLDRIAEYERELKANRRAAKETSDELERRQLLVSALSLRKCIAEEYFLLLDTASQSAHSADTRKFKASAKSAIKDYNQTLKKVAALTKEKEKCQMVPTDIPNKIVARKDFRPIPIVVLDGERHEMTTTVYDRVKFGDLPKSQTIIELSSVPKTTSIRRYKRYCKEDIRLIEARYEAEILKLKRKIRILNSGYVYTANGKAQDKERQQLIKLLRELKAEKREAIKFERDDNRRYLMALSAKTNGKNEEKRLEIARLKRRIIVLLEARHKTNLRLERLYLREDGINLHTVAARKNSLAYRAKRIRRYNHAMLANYRKSFHANTVVRAAAKKIRRMANIDRKEKAKVYNLINEWHEINATVKTNRIKIFGLEKDAKAYEQRLKAQKRERMQVLESKIRRMTDHLEELNERKPSGARQFGWFLALLGLVVVCLIGYFMRDAIFALVKPYLDGAIAALNSGAGFFKG